MSEGRDIYAAVKASVVALDDLPDGDLRQLLGHLGRKGKTCGAAGRIWGEAMAEATVRFTRQKTEEPEPAGATSPLTDFITTDPDA